MLVHAINYKDNLEEKNQGGEAIVAQLHGILFLRTALQNYFALQFHLVFV